MTNLIGIETHEDRISVTCPYDPEWTTKAKSYAGKWSSEDQVWNFDRRSEQYVRDALLSVFGWSDTSTDLVDVKLTAVEEIRATCDGIRVAGRTVVRATDRDGGAKLGSGVVHLSGGYGSGGSRANWQTVVREGAVFEVRDLPPEAVELIDGREWTVDVVSVDQTPEADRERRIEKLKAEIDSLDLTVEDLFPGQAPGIGPCATSTPRTREA